MEGEKAQYSEYSRIKEYCARIRSKYQGIRLHTNRYSSWGSHPIAMIHRNSRYQVVRYRSMVGRESHKAASRMVSMYVAAPELQPKYSVLAVRQQREIALHFSW